jgi:hypothetical protein
MIHQGSSYLCGNATGITTNFGDHAVVARRMIRPGELIAVFGGKVMTVDELRELGRSAGQIALQIEEGLYLVSGEPSQADWINHSCEPNAMLIGQISLVASRRIRRGEEINFDYATADGSAYDEFECRCGSPHCRGFVRADDWARPELQLRYAGQFSPYLQRRIEAIQPRARRTRLTR